jgi:hypothetical protein
MLEERNLARAEIALLWKMDRSELIGGYYHLVCAV